MIPIRLELSNFLSYRDTAVLDFEGIHLAGISGPNGAGKSSIMEAITWALFGKSRVRSDDDLVNRQVSDDGAAEVRFTFSLQGLNYRVIRRKRPGKTMLLELQMDAGDGSWKPLSEGKLRDTQAAIEDLLRMNYDTFASASFLLQGKADQFTTRTASQRKEILAELLGVTQWERYREQAAVARKEVEGRIGLLDGRLAEAAEELEEETERREALERVTAQHLIIVDKRELKELLLKETLRKEETRKQQRTIISGLEGREKRLAENLRQAQTTLESRYANRRQLAVVVGQVEEISAAYAAWQAADQEVQNQQTLAKQHNEISQAMQPFKLQLAEERSRLRQLQEALTKQAQQVETSRAERTKLKENIATAQEKLAGLQAANEQLSQLQEKLDQAREILQQTTGQRKLWRQELDKLEGQARKMNALAEEKSVVRKIRDEAQDLIESLVEKITIIDEQKQTFSQLQVEQQTLRAQQPALRTDMDQMKERIDTLETAEAAGDCPLCAQPLSEEHRHTVLESLRADGKRSGDSYRANEKRLKALAVEVPQVDKTIKQGPALERERQAQQKRLAQAEARLEEIAKVEAEWSEDGEKQLVKVAASLADESDLKAQTGRLAELEASLKGKKAVQEELQELHKSMAGDTARLANSERLLAEWESEGKTKLAQTSEQLTANNFATEARRELAGLTEQLHSVGYDAALHQAAIEKKQAAAEAQDRFQNLQKAQAALEPLQEAIDDLAKQIAQQEIDLEEQRRQLEESRTQLATLESDSIDLKELQGDVTHLREDEITAAQQVALAQQRLNVLDDVRSLRKELQEQKKSLSLRVQRLAVLEKSCGRKGVQALLIEHALPEIEDSANLLLERLTAGEMSIKFDTQRRLKSRDALAETLDIIISDRVGERPYDNYSGGEQFRINFAIRLALSKLLANRAGARLQTLIVDEGFGSQDPQGRQRLVEAINAVQDDFACILVITHIDELREAFPTRIEVQKDINGSQITVQ